MRPVTALILLPPAAPNAPPAVAWLDEARAIVAECHHDLFTGAGVTDVRIVRQATNDVPFGRRLRDLVRDLLGSGPRRQHGLVVVGGGAMPLLRPDDAEAFVATALGRGERALANCWYSADAFAVADASVFLDLSDLPSDNAVPRWLAERAGIPVADLRDRGRLAMDLDSPLDVVLVARDAGANTRLQAVAANVLGANPAVQRALAGVQRVLDDRRAELLVAGRTSSRTLAWLEVNAACRVRAWVEERGLRASSDLALGDRDTWGVQVPGKDRPPAERVLRPPHSLLGRTLDAEGPAALGAVLADLADAALIDTRVLLAHRLGPDERGWPTLADRLASDLLDAASIADLWLRDLTAAAATAPIPVLLGGHSLVGPGTRLLRATPAPTSPGASIE